MSERCAGRVWMAGRYFPGSCSKEGVIEHGGRFWCKIHHPPTVAERTARRNAAKQAERDELDKHRRAAAALAQRRADALECLRELVACRGTRTGVVDWSVTVPDALWRKVAEIAGGD